MTREQLKKELRSAGIYFPANQLKATLQKIYDDNLDENGKLKVYAPGEYVVPEKPVKLEKSDETEEPIIEPDEDLEQGIGDESNNGMDALLNQIETAEAPPKQNKPEEPPLFEATKTKKKKNMSSPDSFRVEGYILMLAIDTVFPFTLSMINNMLDKRNKIDPHQLSLSETDFAKLSPLADQAADYLAINLNPIAGFFLTASFMYGSNLMNVRMQVSVNK